MRVIGHAIMAVIARGCARAGQASATDPPFIRIARLESELELTAAGSLPQRLAAIEEAAREWMM